MLIFKIKTHEGTMKLIHICMTLKFNQATRAKQQKQEPEEEE